MSHNILYFPCLDLKISSEHILVFLIQIPVRFSTLSLPANFHFLFKSLIFPCIFNTVSYNYLWALTHLQLSGYTVVSSFLQKSLSHFRYHIEQKDSLIKLFWLSFLCTFSLCRLYLAECSWQSPLILLSISSLRLLISTYFPFTWMGCSVQFLMTSLASVILCAHEIQSRNLITAII